MSMKNKRFKQVSGWFFFTSACIITAICAICSIDEADLAPFKKQAQVPR
ncbi:hypothetical protein [Superficieibacter electus]|nr:hypothetical protein [Superficieibacter electus]